MDAIAPDYDQSIGTLAAYGGKAPLVTRGIWRDISPDDLDPQIRMMAGHLITYNNLRYMADVMLPRAVGYSAGMIDHFFRGRLEVLPIEESIFAVLNQGEAHYVNAEGYPRRVGGSNKIFGFESVRLRLRNATADIVESGTGTVVPQTTGGAGSRLVAIARYHRNACYQPDLSGERVEAYDGTITEPACPSGLPVRTDYQEISVSASLTLAQGELDGTNPVGKQFDFSADPIPVNATDLFIQVAYRGPLGEEADGIALGSYDVSEPTFAAAWNNTDYFWNGSQWLAANAGHPRRSIRDYRACAGYPSRYIYSYTGAPGTPAMLPPPDPGYVRLAFLFGKPTSFNGRFAVRSIPIMQEPPKLPMRSAFIYAQSRQANWEVIEPMMLGDPRVGCFGSPPALEMYWCFDPVQARRGIAFGEMAQPLHEGDAASDVDSVPLPPWAMAQARDGGDNRFNWPGPLVDCPPQPEATPEELEYQDLLEELEFFGD